MMWTAFLLGLLGSIHCLAMCGPLVMALNSKRQQSFTDKMLYNSGRIFTYGCLGVIAGIFGSGIGLMIGQQYLSIFTGLLLFTGLLASWLVKFNHFKLLSGLLNWVKSRISTMLTAGATGQWWFGVYNGLLPCGLTYVALATAISTGSLFNAVIYMVIFGIGTSPMMWTVVTGFNSLRLKRGIGNKIIAGFTWMLAVLLIIRGLGLGIPYLSPDAGHQHEIHTSNNH